MRPDGEGPVRLEFDRSTLLLPGLAGEAVRALAFAEYRQGRSGRSYEAVPPHVPQVLVGQGAPCVW